MATPNALTLSSATFAKLSPHPYLVANLEPPDASVSAARTNGRQPRQARQPNINLASLSHAHGSAVVRTGDTAVICGVRAESLLTSDIPNYRAPEDDSSASTNELRDYELLVPNIELATGCAPNFLPGVPPTSLAQTLSTRVYSLLHSSQLVDPEDLRIWAEQKTQDKGGDDDESMDDADGAVEEEDAANAREVKAYWVLYIDLLFISFDGNAFDAAWASILAALRNTKLPKAYWDADREMVLCSRQEEPASLNLRGLPIACTAAIFTQKEKQKRGGGKFWVLVDPDRLEETLCDETITIVMDRSGGSTKILSISKSGGTVAGPEVLAKYASVAESRWDEFRAALV